MQKFFKNRHTYGEIEVFFKGKVFAGSFCSIADGVCAVMEGHRTNHVSTFPFTCRHLQNEWGSAPEYGRVTKGDIHIGNDVWIGTDVMFLSGVTVGDGAVIGARAVVTRDIPPYTVAVGMPAKPIKKRFTDDQIESLLKIKWWTWSDDKIKRFLPLLESENIDEFIKEAEHVKHGISGNAD